MKKHVILSLLLIPSKLYAYGSLITNNRDQDLGEIVLRVINFIAPLLGGVALIFVVYGGVLFITSSGNPEKLTKARITLLYAIIGVLVIALSWAIVVQSFKIINNVT